jgi:hypothetical protein
MELAYGDLHPDIQRIVIVAVLLCRKRWIRIRFSGETLNIYTA